MSARLERRDFGTIPVISLFLMALVGLGVFPGPSGGQETGAWADSAYAALRADLQRVISNQEVFFQAHGRYESDLDLLSCETSPGVTVMIGVSEEAFSAVAIHRALGPDFGCSVYVGDMDPAGFPARPDTPGTVACTEGAPDAPLAVFMDPMAKPVYIPHDEAPHMKNPTKFLKDLERMYPRDLRARWVEGTVQLSLFVCDQGTVQKAVLASTSGEARLDEVALLVAEDAIFEPAIKDGDPVGVWVTIPVTFRVRD